MQQRAGHTLTTIGNVGDPTLEDLKASVAANPADPVAHRDLGQLLYESLEFEEALQFFARALELDPSDAESSFWIGRVHFGHYQDLPAALPHLEYAVRLDPEYATARWLLARVQKQLGLVEHLEEHAQALDRAGKREWAQAIRGRIRPSRTEP